MSGSTWQVARKCFVADILAPPQAPHHAPARVWLQGVAVAAGLGEEAEARGFVLDDGTGVIPVDGRKLPSLATSSAASATTTSSSPSPSPSSSTAPCAPGSYVLVIGTVIKGEGSGARTVVAAKLVDLSADPNRESMWYLEVIESSLRLA